MKVAKIDQIEAWGGSMHSVILLVALGVFFQAQGALKPLPVKPQKILIGSGSMAGGIAGTGFSLMNLKTMTNLQTRSERLMFDVGDIDGHPMKGLPGYFNVELKNNAKRIVVDFSQMPTTLMDSKALSERLKKSTYVQSVKMLSDPSDHTLSLIMELKKPVKLKVFQVPGQKSTSKLVLDLFS